MAAIPKMAGDLFPGEQQSGPTPTETAPREHALHDELTATDRARLAEHARAQARSWTLVGKGSGCPRLLRQFKKAKKSLARAYGPGRTQRPDREIPEIDCPAYCWCSRSLWR